jgi:alkaline phosphatase D
MPLSILVAGLCLAALAQAANNHLDQHNLAYRSPYLNHDSLALDTHAIVKRHEESHSILRKRQAQQAAPSGTPDNYITAGYGLGVVDWADANYIFGGNLNFTHAVASGDPYDYSILLWTRALPVEQAAVDVPVCVTYNVFDGLGGSVSLLFEYTSIG